MIETRYLKYMLAAALATLVISSLFYLKGNRADYLLVMAGYLFAVAFVSLVVVRLPVFRGYYRRDEWSIEVKRRSWAEHKAAPVMASVVTVLALWPIVELADLAEPGVAVICSAITAGIMSNYHDRSWW